MGKISLQEKVERIMERSLKARADDNYLAYRVYHDFYHKTPYEALVHREALKLPSVESIGRCRRKAQQERPELIADLKKESIRIESQREWIEYADEIRCDFLDAMQAMKGK